MSIADPMHRPFHQEVLSLIETSKDRFLKISRGHKQFLLFFIALLFFEAVTFFAAYPLFPTSLFTAVSCTLFFLTLFFFLTLCFYARGKKEDRLSNLLDTFVLECQELIPFRLEELEYHSCLSFGLRKFVEELEFQESEPLWSFGKWEGVGFLGKVFWFDFYRMKELLLHCCVQEHLEMVKMRPINLEVHASLANAYILLSHLYKAERPQDVPRRMRESFAQKFRQVVICAIEEFKILKEYAPDDPWVHAQLAYSFKDLNLVEREIEEYEIIVSLRPSDQETLFHLGSLYFQQGLNASGLRVYESLRRLDKDRADLLISMYGENLEGGGK